MATEALIAQVLIGKYGDHLPLYRQSQIFVGVIGVRTCATCDRTSKREAAF